GRTDRQCPCALTQPRPPATDSNLPSSPSVDRGLAGLRDAMRELVQHAAQLPGVHLPHQWNVFDQAQAPALDHAVWSLRAAANLSRVFAPEGPGQSDMVRIETIDQMTAQMLQEPIGSVPAGDEVRALDEAWTSV